MAKRRLTYAGLGLLLTLVIAFGILGHTLWQNRQAKTDAYLVLGGSIRREMYMAQLASTLPDPQPIVLSAGSADPCLRLLFDQVGASLENVWIEPCAESTFGNFVYSVPLMKTLGATHVSLVTSGSHTHRALAMARILFAVQGIWVKPLQVDEVGVPGNRETTLKTILDVGRSVLWAFVSRIYTPQCDGVKPLAEVNLDDWRQRGFKCEHQGGIEGS